MQVYRLKNISSIDISPDENQVVYAEQKLDKEEDKSLSNLFMTYLSSGETIQLTFSGKDRSPVFSPDGSRLAFISSRDEKSQIWILPLKGGEAWKTTTKESVSGPLIWTPDGKKLIYTSAVFSHDKDSWTPYPGAPEYDKERLQAIADKPHTDTKEKKSKKENAVKVITRFNYKRDGLGYYGDVRSQVFITDVPNTYEPGSSPTSEQLTCGDYDHYGTTLSPCGKYIIVSARRTKDADLEQKSDLWLWEIESKKAHLLYNAPGPTYSPCWSPCGKFIAYLGHDNKEGASTSTHLWIMEVSEFVSCLFKGNEPMPLTCEVARNVTEKIDRTVRGPLGWQDNRLIFLLMDRGAGCIYEVFPFTEPKPIIEDRGKSVANLKVGKEKIAYVYTTPTKPDELYVFRKAEEQNSSLNTQYTEQLSTAEGEELT